jgi:Rieske Fe-S protein
MSQESSRRTFVAGMAAAAAALPLARSACAQDAPTSAPASQPAGDWVSTIKSDKLKTGEFNSEYATKSKFILSRVDNKVYALDTKCTHKGCAVAVKTGKIICPCHMANYDGSGAVTKGPATKPLALCAIRVNADGTLEVDPTKKLAKDDADSSVEIKPVA